jgi:hypothetical protein
LVCCIFLIGITTATSKGLRRRAQVCSSDYKEEKNLEANCGPVLLEAPLETRRSLGSADSILELDTQAYSELLSKASSRLSPGVDSVCEWALMDSQCVNREPEIVSQTVERSIAEITGKKVTAKKRKKRNCYYHPRKRK